MISDHILSNSNHAAEKRGKFLKLLGRQSQRVQQLASLHIQANPKKKNYPKHTPKKKKFVQQES